MSPRTSVSLVFLLHGLSTGTWLSRIPSVQEHLGLGEAALGLALLGSGLGSLLSMVPAGAFIARHGSRTMVLATAVPWSLSLVLIALAGNGPLLFGALIVWGGGAAALDVSMNAQGSAIQEERGRPILSWLHGMWSLGTMVGGGLSTLLTSLGIGIQSQFFVQAPLLFGATALLSRAMLAGSGGAPGHALVRPNRALIALAIVTFCGVTAEGAMYDWSGVYLRRVFDAPEGLAASGAAWLAASMAIGRLIGDAFTARFGAPALTRACAALSAAGMLVVILAPMPGFVFGGLIALGFGLSILVPLAFGAAGRAPGMAPGAAIAAVATVGYFGFLAAPPTIGFVAEQLSLRGAFVILLALLLLIGLLAPATGVSRTSAARQLSRAGSGTTIVPGSPDDSL